MLSMNMPKETKRFAQNVRSMLFKRFLFTRLANVEVLLLEKEDMHYEKKDMEVKNSPSLQSQQKQQRRLYKFSHAQNVRRRR